MSLLNIFNEWLKGEPKGSREVSGVVQEAPKQVDYFERLAFIESSNNPKAKAKTSSAAGLYQFTEGTWQEYTKKMGKSYTLDDRFDPKKAREVVEYKTQDIVKRLGETLGREPNNPEKYMAHFMGVTGARRFLQAKPTDTVDKVASKAQIEANKAIFLDDKGKPKTVMQVYSHFREKFK
jgi:hypothetical protein